MNFRGHSTGPFELPSLLHDKELADFTKNGSECSDLPSKPENFLVYEWQREVLRSDVEAERTTNNISHKKEKETVDAMSTTESVQPTASSRRSKICVTDENF